MFRKIVLVLIGCSGLIYLSCAIPVPSVPETKAPEVDEKGVQKSAGDLGWEEEWQKTIAAAKKEGKVTLYISGGMATVKAMIEIMKEKFSMDLEYVIGKGSQVAAKVLAERNAGLYLFDIFVSGSTTLSDRLEPSGALDLLEPTLILPEVKDPNKWWGGGLPYLNDKRLALTFVGTVKQPILFNSNLLRKDEISSYWDLLKPKWKERIVFYDPTQSGGGNTFFTAASMKIVGLDFFKELVKQNPMIVTDNRLVVEWVAKGKYAIALGASSEAITEFKKAGAPLDELTPKEGTYVSSSGGNIGFINKAPHPNAAIVFINFLLSKEGQDIWAVNDGVQSLRLDATTKHLKPDEIRQPGVNYIITDKGEVDEAKAKYREIAKEVFAPLMKAR